MGHSMIVHFIVFTVVMLTLSLQGRDISQGDVEDKRSS